MTRWCLRWGAALLAGLLLADAGLPAADPVADIVKRSQQILAEEQRQHQVGRQLDGVALQLKGLVEELASNGLEQSAQAQEIARTAGLLEKVAAGHVRKAGEQLREARRHLGDGRHADHLKQAEREIGAAIAKLNDLVALAGALEKTEGVRQALADAIKKQEALHQETRDAGKQFEEKTLPSPDATMKALAGAQKGVAEQVEKLQEALDKARQTASPEQQKQLDKAAEALKNQNPGGRLNAAADQLKDKNPLGAAGEQKQALNDLKEIARGLDTPGERKSPGEDAKRIGELLDKLKKLGEATQNTPPQNLPQLSPEQDKLAEQTKKAAQQTAEPEIAKCLNGACDCLKRAGAALREGNAGEALKQQGLARSELQKANPEPQVRGPDRQPGTGTGMQPGMGMGMQPVAGKGTSQPGSGRGEGQERPGDKQGMGEARAEPGPSRLATHEKGIDPREGPRQLLKTTPRAGPFGRDRANLDTLGPRERAAVVERYLRELPLEYREILRAYYEALANRGAP